jgi:hypothetical protein
MITAISIARPAGAVGRVGVRERRTAPFVHTLRNYCLTLWKE